MGAYGRPAIIGAGTPTHSAHNEVFVSVATLWEIAIKYQIGRGDMPVSARRAAELFRAAGFAELSILREHALAVESRRTAEVLGPRGEEFLRLKVEGILSCGELLIAALSDGREAHVFGRRTLPEMDLCSVACAIQNLWLCARVEGLGMGWV